MVPVAVLLSLQINGAGHLSADMQCMSTARSLWLKRCGS